MLIKYRRDKKHAIKKEHPFRYSKSTVDNQTLLDKFPNIFLRNSVQRLALGEVEIKETQAWHPKAAQINNVLDLKKTSLQLLIG